MEALEPYAVLCREEVQKFRIYIFSGTDMKEKKD